MSEAYIIKSTVRHTKPFHDRFSETVFSVPFNGPKRLRQEYYLQIRRFLVHLDHNQNYGYRSDSSMWIPVPYKLLWKEFPLVFGPNRTLTTKAIHFLSKSKGGIIEVKPYVPSVRCREFRIKREIRAKWYGENHDLETSKSFIEYKSLQRGYDVSRELKGQHSLSWGQMLEKAEKAGLGRPKPPNVAHLRRYPGAQRRYKTAYSKMQPNQIDFDVILKVIWMLEAKTFTNLSEEDQRIARLANLRSCLASILDSGVRVVSRDPEASSTLIEYYPRYTVAAIGGRGFEMGSGFQNFPGWVKSACSLVPNYDIKNSQLSILRLLLNQHKIPCTFFDEFPDLQAIAIGLGILRDDVKPLIYGLIFNGGATVFGPYSKAWINLTFNYGKRASAIQRHWNVMNRSLSVAIRQLIDALWTEGIKSSVYSWSSPTGIRFQTEARNSKAERQLLAHYLQGIESDYILSIIENPQNRVHALEHDGFMGFLGAKPPTGKLKLEQKKGHGKAIRKAILRATNYDEMMGGVWSAIG